MKCQQVTNYDVWFNLQDSIRLFRILIFHSLKLGIRDFKAKSRRDSGLKVSARAGDGMPKINLGITGLKNAIKDPVISHFNKSLIIQ